MDDHSVAGGSAATPVRRSAPVAPGADWLDAARERSELRRELRALTAQARMSRWIVTLLPPAVLGILLLVRPSYLHPLFHSTGGIIALLLATSLVVLGSLVMRMLVPAEV